jgi:uncharacterized protein (TIGR04255 family)
MPLKREAFPQEELDEVFINPPLREVDFEVKFVPRLRVAAELWKLQDQWAEECPGVGVEPLLQPDGNIIQLNVFQNRATGYSIKISQQNLLISRTKYSTFEQFKEEANLKVQQFCSQFDIKSFTRVGLRYINNILLPTNEPASLTRYVHPMIDLKRLRIENVEQFASEIRTRVENHMVTLRGVLLSPLPDGKLIYVLDIDSYSEQPHKPAQIPEVLEKYHEIVQLVFLDHITEEYKNIMRGKR